VPKQEKLGEGFAEIRERKGVKKEVTSGTF